MEFTQQHLHPLRTGKTRAEKQVAGSVCGRTYNDAPKDWTEQRGGDKEDGEQKKAAYSSWLTLPSKETQRVCLLCELRLNSLGRHGITRNLR